MRGLSLTQPWGSLVMLGAKTVETRSWSTAYRGPLAIHVAQNWPTWAQDYVDEHDFRTVLWNAYGPQMWEALHAVRGCLVATCRLIDCVPTTGSDLLHLSAQEQAFGDYSYGRYAFLLDTIEPLPEPIPYRGALGLFAIDPVILKRAA